MVYLNCELIYLTNRQYAMIYRPYTYLKFESGSYLSSKIVIYNF